ncbi:MAG: hypothetical protein JRJ83_03495, partial [Deltaproteobacteria bacterium]|nr:hypothetical protein [Deltaproteobacteria bacterium]
RAYLSPYTSFHARAFAGSFECTVENGKIVGIPMHKNSLKYRSTVNNGAGEDKCVYHVRDPGAFSTLDFLYWPFTPCVDVRRNNLLSIL